MKQLLLTSILIILMASQSFAQCSTNVSGTFTSCSANCNGSVTFTSITGTPPYNLVVTGGPSTQYASTYTWTNVCPGSYHYDVTGASSSCHDTGTVVVTALPNVTPPALTIEAYDLMGNFLGNNPTICQFQSVEFYIQLPYEVTEPKIFKWKKNGIVQSTQTAVNPSPPGIAWNSASLANGDVITLTIVFTNPPPCYSPDSVTSQSIIFTVTSNQPPSLTVTDNMPNDTICYGNPITFTANPIEAGTPTYQWYLDGAPVGTASLYTTLATLANGNHQIWCTITSGEYCDTQDPVFNPTVTSSTTNFYIQTCIFASVQDITNSPITLSPNPAKDQFTIYDVRFTISEIGVYNMLGEKVLSQKPTAKSQKQIGVDVSNLSPGIYLVKLRGEKGESVAKFVKQ